MWAGVRACGRAVGRAIGHAGGRGVRKTRAREVAQLKTHRLLLRGADRDAKQAVKVGEESEHVRNVVRWLVYRLEGRGEKILAVVADIIGVGAVTGELAVSKDAIQANPPIGTPLAAGAVARRVTVICSSRGRAFAGRDALHAVPDRGRLGAHALAGAAILRVHISAFVGASAGAAAAAHCPDATVAGRAAWLATLAPGARLTEVASFASDGERAKAC